MKWRGQKDVLVFVENEIQRIRGILIYSHHLTASKAILNENEDEQIIREVNKDTKHVKGMDFTIFEANIRHSL